MQQDKQLSMTVGRDYRAHGKYEYVIYAGELIVAREGWFKSSQAARQAGLKVADKLNPARGTNAEA